MNEVRFLGGAVSSEINSFGSQIIAPKKISSWKNVAQKRNQRNSNSSEGPIRGQDFFKKKNRAVGTLSLLHISRFNEVTKLPTTHSNSTLDSLSVYRQALLMSIARLTVNTARLHSSKVNSHIWVPKLPITCDFRRKTPTQSSTAASHLIDRLCVCLLSIKCMDC